VSLSTLLVPLLHGAVVTLKVTGLSGLLAGVVAFLFGFARLAHNPLIRLPSAIFIEVFRGTSALVLMFWFFFALPLLGLTLKPLTAGVLALGLSYGAYAAEVVRGAVLQVPKGQIEAGIALNYSYLQRVRLVILPQAVLAMLPPLGNLLVDLLKGTSLVSLITLSDLTFRGRLEQEALGHTTEVFTLLLIIYFVMCFILTRGVRLMERRVSRYLQIYVPPGGVV
jgi:polar amino acid transport system permease protein